jgi:sec-independent protein translocase protein TatA
MGLDSIWHWAILLVIILLVFGTGKLTRVGSDLGNAVRGFKKAMQGDEDEEKRKAQEKVQAEKLQADPPPSSEGAAAGQHQRDSSESK